MIILNEIDSYFLGLFLTDGNFYEYSRNRGRIAIELSMKDYSKLSFLKENLLVNSALKTRKRDTNFKKNYTSCTLSIYDLNYRNWFKSLGINPGSKTNIIPKINAQLDINHYIRGLIDGDGSVGFLKSRNNFPFVGFVTKSEELFNTILNFYKKHIGNRKFNIKRNKRDGVYNVVFVGEDAVKICEAIYINDACSIERKAILTNQIKK